MKRILEDRLPPILTRVLHGRNTIRWSGDYDSWAKAKKVSTGYDNPIILEKVLDASLKVKRGEAVFERDSVLFEKIQYSWPLLAGLLRVACANSNRLRVLDFGGSLGSTYYQNKGFLSGLAELRWCVVEQKNFVDYGKQYFENEELRFYYDLLSCMADEVIDVVILSSVLPYLEKPYHALNMIMNYEIGNIIVDRTPFLLSGNKDRLTVQKNPSSIYEVSYPAWFFSKKNFLGFMGDRGYAQVAEFESFGRANIRSTFKGYIFEKTQEVSA